MKIKIKLGVNFPINIAFISQVLIAGFKVNATILKANNDHQHCTY